jgi:hypothetical protein
MTIPPAVEQPSSGSCAPPPCGGATVKRGRFKNMGIFAQGAYFTNCRAPSNFSVCLAILSDFLRTLFQPNGAFFY